MANTKDDEIASLKARIARLETSPQTVAPKLKLPPKMKRAIKIAAAGFFGSFALLWLYSEIFSPRTVGEFAEQYKQDCIRDKGNGEWYGSSGLSLEQFCEAAGNLQALEADRKEHPGRY